MRSLATDTYTQVQVEAALRAGTGVIGCRFQVLDNSNTEVGWLDVTDDQADPKGVTAATVEWDAERAIIGALKLTMLADADLRGLTFQRRIKAYFNIAMPDGGTAEWAMGVYLWNKPQRTVDGGVETWDITLGDLGHILDAGGPGTGWTVPAGAVLTTEIERILAAAGFTDTSGIVPSTATAASTIVFDAEGSRDRPETYRSILRVLTDALGYKPLWFDHDGLPRATVLPDLATAPTGMVYSSAQDGITLYPLKIQPMADKIANRLFGRTTGAPPASAVVTAEDLYGTGGHPLAKTVIGFYIDDGYSDTVALNAAALTAGLRNALARRLSYNEAVTFTTLAWPAHEVLEVIAARIDDDAELVTETRYLELSWSIDLFGGDMAHKARKLG